MTRGASPVLFALTRPWQQENNMRTTHWLKSVPLQERVLTSLLLTCQSVIHGDIQTKKDQKGLATMIASCSALPDRLITTDNSYSKNKIFRNTWNEHLLRSACSWLSFGKIFKPTSSHPGTLFQRVWPKQAAGGWCFRYWRVILSPPESYL